MNFSLDFISNIITCTQGPTNCQRLCLIFHIIELIPVEEFEGTVEGKGGGGGLMCGGAE